MRRAYASIVRVLAYPLRSRHISACLADIDVLLVVGTGVLDDFGVRPSDLPSWLLSWCQGARRSRARLHFVAVGAGPIRNHITRFLMMRALRLANSRSFRDRVSRDFVASQGIDTTDDRVVPDLVFGLTSDVVGRSVPPATSPRTIGVGLMGYFGWTNHEKSGAEIYTRYVQGISRFVLWLLERGYRIRLLIGETYSDERAVRDVLDWLRHNAADESRNRICAPSVRSPTDLLREIAQTDLVVATRYHNVICALALGRPVISLGYASKFDALMQDFGLGDYCQDVEQLDVDRLIGQFRELAEESGTIHLRIRTRTEAYRATLTGYYQELFTRIEGERRSNVGQ
jgi:polysaccharide pyruvyl transferase WcaK-like protein